MSDMSDLNLTEKATLYALACRIVRVVESDSFADEVLAGARGTDDVNDYGQVFTGQLAITKSELKEAVNQDQMAREKCRHLLSSLQHTARPAFLVAWPRYRFRYVKGPVGDAAAELGHPLGTYLLTFRWTDPDRVEE